MNYVLEFKIMDGWKPLMDGCEKDCPLCDAIGFACAAKDLYDDTGYIRCPVVKGIDRVRRCES